MILLQKLPFISHYFNVGILDKGITKFFRSIIVEMMETRKANNIHRPDMINILMQVRDGWLERTSTDAAKEASVDGFATVHESNVGKAVVTRKWTDDELNAQCFLFFFAGFETSSTILSFAAYELLINPDIQQRLYEEIADTEEELQGKGLAYDAIQKMKYMDQVVSEILRKWPPFVNIDRHCVKDYQLDHSGKRFKIEKKSVVWFPAYALHHDPQYYPAPERFDPERFSDENRGNIVQGTYIPFGIGPRNCIGACIYSLVFIEMDDFSFQLYQNFHFITEAPFPKFLISH